MLRGLSHGLVLVLLLSNSAWALLIRPYGAADLYGEAERIVVGQVVEQRSFWNNEKDRIYTEFTVRVERIEKGREVPVVVVRILGGAVDHQELVVSGTPTFQPGERVLLFLKDRGEFHAVVGMHYGKWSVVSRNGVDHVVPGAAPAPGMEPEVMTTLEELLKDGRNGGGRGGRP
jgi:hypothetical protein